MAELSIYNPEGSRIMSREMNQSDYKFDRNVTREPENIITIFTVNKRPQYSTSAGVMLQGREASERYRKVGTITDPKYYVDTLSIEGSRDQHKVSADDGIWVAMDWLNPANVFKRDDQDFIAPNAVDDGTNLLQRGLFFIVRPYSAKGNADDKPTEAEIASAEQRLRTRYTALVRIYHETSTANPSKLPNIMSDEMIDALNFAGVKTPYNSTLDQKVTCQNCGEMIPASAKFHRSEALGMICIQPNVEGWKAAVAAGIKKRDEVPDEFKWPGRSPSN